MSYSMSLGDFKTTNHIFLGQRMRVMIIEFYVLMVQRVLEQLTSHHGQRISHRLMARLSLSAIALMKLMTDNAADVYSCKLPVNLLCVNPPLFHHTDLLYKASMNATTDKGRCRLDQPWSILRSLLSRPSHGKTVCIIHSVDECKPSKI